MESESYDGASVYRFADEAADSGCSEASLINCKFKPDLMDEKALAFMDDHDRVHPGKPMFLYYATPGVRSAGSLDEGLPPADLYTNCPASSFTNHERRNFCAGVASVDKTIHNVVTKLEGWSGDYVLIIASDNGGSTWASYAGANNWPLRGNKNEAFEGAIRTKAFVYGRHPQLDSSPLRGKTYNKGPIHLMDFHMMIAELAGYTGRVNPHAPASQPELDEGHSGMWNVLVNDQESPRKKMAGHGLLMSYAIDWPFKAVWGNTWGLSTKDGVSAGRFHKGHWWPVRTGDTNAFLMDQVNNILTDPTGKKHNGGSEDLLFNLNSDESETTPLNDPDRLNALKAQYNNDAKTHFITPNDNNNCQSPTPCAQTRPHDPALDKKDNYWQIMEWRRSIDDARLTQSGHKTLIATACPSDTFPSVSTVAPYECLSDVGWCPSS